MLLSNSTSYVSGRLDSYGQRATSEKGMGACCITSAISVTVFALFIIGCVAASGGMTNVSAGGAIIGITVPLLLYTICNFSKQETHFAKNKALFEIIAGIFALVVAFMALAGTVSVSALGWAVVAPLLIEIPFLSCIFARNQREGSYYFSSLCR